MCTVRSNLKPVSRRPQNNHWRQSTRFVKSGSCLKISRDLSVRPFLPYPSAASVTLLTKLAKLLRISYNVSDGVQALILLIVGIISVFLKAEIYFMENYEFYYGFFLSKSTSNIIAYSRTKCRSDANRVYHCAL